MRHQIETLAKGITESMGGTCDIAFRAGYPAVYNDVEFTKTVEQASAAMRTGFMRTWEMAVRRGGWSQTWIPCWEPRTSVFLPRRPRPV